MGIPLIIVNGQEGMVMALWIQFFNRKLDGKLGEALGSEGLQRLDGRLGVKSAVQEAYSRAYQLRKVQQYEAFQIMQGNIPSKLVPVTKVTETSWKLWPKEGK